MTWVDGGVGGEVRYDVVERVEHLLVGAALKVGAADAHAEESVATEGGALFLAVEDDTAGGMARGVKDLQTMGAELNDVLIGQIAAHGGDVEVDVDAKDFVGLPLHLLHQELVAGVGLGLEAEGTVDITVAHAVVEMAVGAEQSLGGEAAVADIADDGLALFRIESPAIDDDALAGVVADDVAVLGEHVAVETLDVEHRAVGL